MSQVEKRFGGQAVVKLDSIKDILVAKMKADARDLIAVLSRADRMGEFEEQNRLLAEFQSAHRALHVITGVVTVNGSTILIAPPTQTGLGDDTAANTGLLGVGQALDEDHTAPAEDKAPEDLTPTDDDPPTNQTQEG